MNILKIFELLFLFLPLITIIFSLLRAKEFTDQFLVKHEFIKRLHKRYKEEGVTISFPIQTVYLSKS